MPLKAHLERRGFAPRALVVRKGEPADELFVLVRGELSVLVDAASGRLRRLATPSPGMGFGEPFLVEHARRSAFVRADRPSTPPPAGRSAAPGSGGSRARLRRSPRSCSRTGSPRPRGSWRG